ncbi:MAG: hypothetical protein QME55_05945 [Brevundimonas sp.]|uniref:hypothetical protein n=1 Tax=Brevundimonas sp. TaxID=1871086 RepID=UPI0026272047|nr:hypothetical protein [Brevundimonas sp.]MDI6624253.1 hypothetical protein [Brevundimonas sp.]MDQ7813927.1 hypothetical protein [Brevundimonas sp.]
MGGDDVLDGGDGEDLAVLAGVRADYLVSAEADGAYRVADSVTARDGVDLLIGVERVRFSDGTTALLSDLVTGSAPPATMMSASGDDPQILPGLADDDFILAKGATDPLILPDDDLIDELAPQGRFGGDTDVMLTLFDDGFMGDALGLIRQLDGLDDWM